MQKESMTENPAPKKYTRRKKTGMQEKSFTKKMSIRNRSKKGHCYFLPLNSLCLVENMVAANAWGLTTPCNCSETMFVAIILALLVFLYAIFRLTEFFSDPFDFSSLKRAKHLAPSGQ